MLGPRDETQNLVRRVSRLCNILDYCRTRGLERVGISIPAPEQRSTATPTSHDHEQEDKTIVEKEPKIPESWNLSLK